MRNRKLFCIWKKICKEEYKTDCLSVDNIKLKNGFLYCPYCGGKIIIIEEMEKMK